MTSTARLNRQANYQRRMERTQPIDWAAASAAAAQLLLGDPNPRLSNRRERRWGRKGSLALNLETGFWKDYEADETGGTLQLIARQTGWRPQQAMEWLVEQGIIPPRPEADPTGSGYLSTSENPAPTPTHASASTTTALPEHIFPAGGATTPEQARQKWQQGQPLEAIPLPRPVAAWLRRRRLWPPDAPLPAALRWLEKQTGPTAGQIAVLLAPAPDWQAAWPDLPPPQALQLIAIDAQGRPAADKPPPEPPRDKRNLGPSHGALLLLGNPRYGQPWQDLQIAEGAADALAIAARRPGPALAVLGAGALNSPRLEQWLLAEPWRLLIYTDADRPGRRAAKQLYRRMTAAGRECQVRQPNFQAEDPAAAAALARRLTAPLAEIQAAAARLQRESPHWPEWELLRQARLSLLPELY